MPSKPRFAPSTEVAKFLPLGLALVFVGVLYSGTAISLAQNWELDPNYSHGFIVPIASLYFLWTAWAEHGSVIRSQVATRDFAVGIGEISLGLVLHTVSLTNLLLDVISLICVLRGLLLVVGGRQVNELYGFGILFLVFMAPIPALWYTPVAILMQQIASAVSAGTLELCGVPVFREGYLIHIPGYTMEVGEACSGLRQVVSVLAFSVALGHINQRGLGYTWTLALSSVPVSIAANCFRVILTGVILMLFGKEYADGVFHTLEGLVVNVLAAAMVFAVSCIMNRVWNRPQAESTAAVAAT